MFLFRLLGALAAAAVAFFAALVVSVLLDNVLPEGGEGCLVLVAMLGAGVWAYRRIGAGKLSQQQAERQIRKLKEQAAKRAIAPRAFKVASVLGGGSYATGTLRISGNPTLSVEIPENTEGGAWRTVFTAQWQSEVAGQVVPYGIRPDPDKDDRYPVHKVLTRREGHQPAHWEVLAYIPGEWEDELNRLWETAKEAGHEREKSRFGLE
jgi:hypothetical protein